jgi:hypothetical protein
MTFYMSRFNYSIEPMTLGNVREFGVRWLDVRACSSARQDGQ